MTMKLSLGFIILICFNVFCVIVSGNNELSFEVNIPVDGKPEIEMASNEDEDRLKIISRDEWLASSSTNQLTDLKLPVEKVVISHTATSTCMTQVKLTV